MNKLNIPSVQQIIKEQKRSFEALGKTNQQRKILQEINQFWDTSEMKNLNGKIKKDLIQLADEFSDSLKAIYINNSQFKKLTESTPKASLNEELEKEYNHLLSLFQKIQQLNQKIGNSEIKQFSQVINNLKLINQKGEQNLRDSLFAIRSNVVDSEGKNISVFQSIRNAEKNIKGIQILEKGGYKFFKQLPSLPNIEIIHTGQQTNKGRQLGQDMFAVDKNFKVTFMENGTQKTVSLKEYFDSVEKANGTSTTISLITSWEDVYKSIVGIQSKYSRHGWITFLKNFSIEEIFKLQLNEAKALRNLYILSKGEYGSTKLRGIYNGDGKFIKRVTYDIRKADPNKHYQALFSYCLSKFMDKIIKHNFYMLTRHGLTDSQSFFRELFGQGQYFRPKGNVDPTNIKKTYDIQINANKI